MEKESGHYFLTATAVKIWRENDTREESQMFACLTGEKDFFFKRVIFKNSSIPQYKLIEFAETAFLQIWMDFRTRGRACTLKIESADYRAYFYKAFKNKYLKLVEKETKTMIGERGFAAASGEFTDDEKESANPAAAKIARVLYEIDKGCRDLLTWYYIEGTSYDDIVKKRNNKINRLSAIKILSRCRKRFLKIWTELK